MIRYLFLKKKPNHVYGDYIFDFYNIGQLNLDAGVGAFLLIRVQIA